ncbi:hypothetical protein [Phycicoccus sp. 3266]|uniref:hypothetical protein n=1 Tax=Phycicoccus sp. 3266 TaxID=2817751 RepID=UPI0028652A46|nr:hypothetical protein [Phycicoccus sp. 3266]MDR6861982.1 hypothetical protein [Phycicoccus sp. 3266]
MFTPATVKIGSDAIAAAITHLSIHTAGDTSSSGSESTAPRQPIALVSDANGNLTAGPISFTGGAANGPAVRYGYWTAASGGTYRGGAMLAGDNAFNAAGEYVVDSVTETAASA